MNPLDYSGADFLRFICGTCRDLRVVSAPEGTAGSVPCPVCGLDEQRKELFTRSKVMPQIRFSEITEPDEQELWRIWRIAGHHELDCLRWIEGRRYKPEKDVLFLEEARARFREWRDARNKEKQ